MIYRRHFLPPSEMPQGTVWYSFPVPDGVEWRTRITGALIELSHEWRWEPLDDRISTEQAARLGQDTLMAWINAAAVRLTGMILPYFGGTIPAGTLLCDGSTHNRADYPALWDVFHPWYKTESTFTLPDLTGRFIMGVPFHDQVGAALNLPYRHIGIEHLPAHSHTMYHEHISHAHAPLPIPVVAPGEFPVASEAIPDVLITSHNTGSTGSGQALDIMPPCITMRYVIIAV